VRSFRGSSDYAHFDVFLAMRTVHLCSLSALFALALCGVACSPTRPSPLPSATLLLVAGADSVAPGGGTQLSAVAVFPDGSTQIVTDEAIWESSDWSVMTVSRGFVTARGQRGEAEIRASFVDPTLPATTAAVRADRRQFVLPAGTYALSGSITDGGVPVNGVEVEVISGIGAGMTATANPEFHFYGVAGDVEIRASKAGYDPALRTVAVTGHQTVELALTPSAGRAIVAGTYTLKVLAAPGCQDRLPERARARTYSATISQVGAQLQVVLSGAVFGSAWGDSNSFPGSVEPGQALFALSPYFGETVGTFTPPSVLEFLAAPSTFVTIFGSVVTTPNEAGYAGFLDGNIEVLALLGGPWDLGDVYSRVALCRSTKHQFTLTRR
jgi:hypothetical protein